MGLFAAGLFADGLFAERLFAEADSPPVIPPTEEGQTPAGRKKPSRRYIVEIDGKEFVLDNLDQVFNLLERAKALAQVAAEKKADSLVKDSLPKALLLGKADPIKVKAPSIKGPPELKAELSEARDRIKRIYRDAAITAELRILMAIEAEQDDEEALLLSL